MRLVPTRQALKLTGLTPVKLREWSSRRALIPADHPPKSQGSSAQYSWQTILVLRLAMTLKEKFCLELKAHREVFTSLRFSLKGHSFIALWDHVLALRGASDWILMKEGSEETLRADAIIVRLNPHLEVLAVGFALPHPRRAESQLDLFPAMTVSGETADMSKPARTISRLMGERRRRVA